MPADVCPCRPMASHAILCHAIPCLAVPYRSTVSETPMPATQQQHCVVGWANAQQRERKMYMCVYIHIDTHTLHTCACCARAQCLHLGYASQWGKEGRQRSAWIYAQGAKVFINAAFPNSTLTGKREGRVASCWELAGRGRGRPRIVK